MQPALSSPERVRSMDVLRGVAVLGILLMNVVAMGLPFAAHDDPTIAGNRGPADFWTWAVAAVLVDGKMRAIFSMLFGAGVVLLARRAESRGSTDDAGDLHMRRTLWLLLFGAVHAYVLLWPGDVLFTYAVAGMPLFVFRRAGPRSLIVMAAIILALQVPPRVLHNLELAEAAAGLRELAQLTSQGGVLTPQQQRSRETWTSTLSDEKPAPESLRRTIDERRQGYLKSFGDSAQASLYLQSMYLYKVGLWDAAAFMLIGMALVKVDAFSAARSFRFYSAMALVGYGVGLPLGIWVVADWMRHNFDAGLRWTSLFDVTRLAVAMGHVSVVMIACKAGAAPWATGPLAAVGRTALTNYILQTVICMAVFRGYGFGWFGQLARHELYYVVAAVWVFQLLASVLWLRQFETGPLEWVWRSLTYQRRQPLRIG